MSRNKTLRLNNVMIVEIQEIGLQEVSIAVQKMENYLKVNGALPIGPLIEYLKLEISNNEVFYRRFLLRQANKYLCHVEEPYSMKNIVRVQNCMYCRYVGPENQINIAGAKLSVLAFEENVSLKGDSYTVFVDQNDDYLVADLFMERDSNE